MSQESSIYEEINAYVSQISPDHDFYYNSCHLDSLKIGQSSVQIRTLLLAICEPKDFFNKNTQAKDIYVNFFVHDGKNVARGAAFGQDAARRLYEKLVGKKHYFITLINVQTHAIDEAKNITRLPYEIRFHQFSNVEVSTTVPFPDLKQLQNWATIPLIQGILASCIQQQPDFKNDVLKNEYRVRFAGTLVDLKTKIEIFFEFEPVEKYPVGATLLINNGKLFRNNDAIRLYIKYSNQVKRLNEPIYDFNELTRMFDVNSLPFP